MKQRLIYIGTSSIIIEKLIISGVFDFDTVICERKRVTPAYLKKVHRYELNILSFSTKAEFENYILSFDPEVVFLIYQLDIIVPGNLTKNYSFFNLHAGSISTNRGAHPIIWSILNNDRITEFTLHRINEKIDQGIIVSSIPIEISTLDNPSSVKIKMENELPTIFNKLRLFLDGKLEGFEAIGGTYNRPICEADYTINLYEDSRIKIINKIRSQEQYKGAVVHINTRKYYINKVVSWESIHNLKNETLNFEKIIKVSRIDCVFVLQKSTQ